MKKKKAPVIIELSSQQLEQATGGAQTFLEFKDLPGLRFHRCPPKNTSFDLDLSGLRDLNLGNIDPGRFRL